jgi:hypothetical protein
MGALRFQVEEQGEQFVLGMAREEKSDFWLRNSNL